MNDPASELSFQMARPLRPADFAYHARAKYWLNEEITCLALGVEPSSGKLAIQEFNSQMSRRRMELTEFKQAYDRLKSLLDRNFHIQQIIRKSPSFWIKWLTDMKLPCPPELISAVEAFAAETVDWKLLAEKVHKENESLLARVSELERAVADSVISQTPITKQRESLLKLVIGMAVKGYSYDPNAGRSPTPKEISDDLQALGIALSDDTVRKYLKEAADFLPGEPSS